MNFLLCVAQLLAFLSGFCQSEAIGESMDFDLGPNFEAAKRGEQKLKDYSSKSSPCWLKAVSELRTKCSEITDIQQSILAMKLSNCHFEKSGMPTYDCIYESEFRECTKTMKDTDPTSFLVYTEFFTHVTDICFYLQSEIWRRKTGETISKLTLTTEKTTAKLDRSLKNQRLVLESQEKSLVNQQKILENEDILQHTLENSTANAKAAFQEMKQKADEQQRIFSSTFDGIFHGVDKLAELQAMLLGEFIGLQSIAFYLASMISCYFFTSSPRTIAARLILFISFAFLVIVEKMVVKWALENQENYESVNEWLHKKIWFARKVFVASSLFVLGYVATRYKDFNQINNKILQELQERIAEIYEIEMKRKEKYSIPICNDEVDDCKKLEVIASSNEAINTLGVKSQRDTVSYSTPQRQWVSLITSLGQSPIPSNTTLDSGNGSHADLGYSERVLFSDGGYDDEDEIDPKKNKKFSKKNFVKNAKKPRKKKEIKMTEDPAKDNVSHNTSRYNLRSRSSTPMNSPQNDLLSASVTSSKKRSTKKPKTNPITVTGLFSSDED